MLEPAYAASKAPRAPAQRRNADITPSPGLRLVQHKTRVRRDKHPMARLRVSGVGSRPAGAATFHQPHSRRYHRDLPQLELRAHVCCVKSYTSTWTAAPGCLCTCVGAPGHNILLNTSQLGSRITFTVPALGASYSRSRPRTATTPRLTAKLDLVW